MHTRISVSLQDAVIRNSSTTTCLRSGTNRYVSIGSSLSPSLFYGSFVRRSTRHMAQIRNEVNIGLHSVHVFYEEADCISKWNLTCPWVELSSLLTVTLTQNQNQFNCPNEAFHANDIWQAINVYSQASWARLSKWVARSRRPLCQIGDPLIKFACFKI